MANRKQIAFRVTPEQDKQLDDISAAMRMTRNEVLVNLILAEHERLMGNPQLLKLVDQMNALKEQLELFGKGGQS